MKKKTSIFTIVLFIITLIVNYLSSFNMIPGVLSQRLVSAKYKTPITPAGYTFSIWGLIYLLLMVSVIYFYLNSDKKEKYSQKIQDATPVLWIMFLANIAWNIVFGLEYIILSAVIIVIYALALFYFTRVLSKEGEKLSLFVKIGFGIHAGWMTAASIVNIYAALYKFNNNIFDSPKNYILAGLAIAFILTLVVTRKIKNPYLPFSVIWAIWGINNNVYVSGMDSKLIYSFVILLTLLLALVSLKHLSEDMKAGRLLAKKK